MSNSTHALTIIAVEGMWGFPVGLVVAAKEPIESAYDALSQFEFWGQRFKVIDDVTSVEHKGDSPDHPIFHRYTTVLAIIWTHHREKFLTNNEESIVEPFSVDELASMERTGDLLLSLSALEHPEVKKVLGG